MAKSILHTIERNMPTFSKGQKRIADYILQNYDKAAFMTASKLGKLSGVSESTVVRFASELGYDGYPSMQRALQEMIRSRLTSTQRIQAADNLFGGQDVLSAVIQSDMDKLRMVAEEADRTEFNKVVDLILGAGHLYILGVRTSSFVDSMVAPLSLINALLIAVGSRMRSDVSRTFAELEDIWNAYGVFGKMDDE